MKVKKLLLIVIMIFTLISSLFIGSANYVDEDLMKAQELTEELFKSLENTEEISYVHSRFLKGLDGANDYILTERDGQGYAIYEKDGFELIEFSANDRSPYLSLHESETYYGGPSNYFRYENNSFYNLNTNKKVKDKYFKDIAKNLKKELKSHKEKRNKKDKEDKSTEKTDETVEEVVVTTANLENNNYNNKLVNLAERNMSINAMSLENEVIDVDLYNVISNNYIDGYQYFLNNNFYEVNTEGICATIAIQLLLGFNNWYFDSRLIPIHDADSNYQFLPDRNFGDYAQVYGDKMIKTTYPDDNYNNKITFYEVLLNYMGDFTTIEAVYNTVNSFLDDYNPNIKNSITHGYQNIKNSTFYNFIDNEIANNRPLYCSILTHDEYGMPSSHAIVVYGKTTIRYQNQTIEGYVANFGWTNWGGANIWVNKNWIYKYYYFQINHVHTKVSYHDMPHIQYCETCNAMSTLGDHTYNVNNTLMIEDKYKDNDSGVIKSKINDTYHYCVCTCGYLLKARHYLNTYIDNGDTHIISCACGYGATTDTLIEDEHYYKAGRQYCYCGHENPAYTH